MRRPRLSKLALWFTAMPALAGGEAAAQAPAPPPAAAPQPPPPYPQPYPAPYPYPAPAPYPYPAPYPAPAPAPAPYPYPPPVVVAPAPPAPARPEPPVVVYNWDPDVPAPAKYQLVDEVNGRLIWAGVGLLAAGWFTSALVASVASAAEDDPTPEPGDITADDWTPLYFPIIGPFVALGSLQPKPSGVGLLVADGVLQMGGALGIVIGFFDLRYKLVRTGQDVRVVPLAGPGIQGLSAVGRF